jgi:hypothetical protein
MIATFDAPLVDSAQKGFGQFFGSSCCVVVCVMCAGKVGARNEHRMTRCRGQQLIVELVRDVPSSFLLLLNTEKQRAVE